MHNGLDAAHRRAILLNGGRAFIAQRYAIDWVRYRLVDGLGTTWSGPEDKNSSYFCYDSPIYSMAPGKVIEMLDGIPENVPHSGKIAIDVNFFNAGGNNVVAGDLTLRRAGTRGTRFQATTRCCSPCNRP